MGNLTVTKIRTVADPNGAGALDFVVQGPAEGYKAGFLTPDGAPGNLADHGCVAFYSGEPQAGAQFVVAPGGEPEQVLSPHVACIRTQRRNGLNEEGLILGAWKDSRYVLDILALGAGKLHPFEIRMGGVLVMRINTDGSREDYWRGYPVMRHEPKNGAVEYATPVKFPVLGYAEVGTHPVLVNAAPGTWASIRGKDGKIRAAIKQDDGTWTRADGTQL